MTAESAESQKSNGIHSTKSGWDGKLRLDKNKKAVLANPEALSDPEYSDEDAPPVEQIEADEDLLEDEDPETEVISLLPWCILVLIVCRKSTCSTVASRLSLPFTSNDSRKSWSVRATTCD